MRGIILWGSILLCLLLTTKQGRTADDPYAAWMQLNQQCFDFENKSYDGYFSPDQKENFKFTDYRTIKYPSRCQAAGGSDANIKYFKNILNIADQSGPISRSRMAEEIYDYCSGVGPHPSENKSLLYTTTSRLKGWAGDCAEHVHLGSPGQACVICDCQLSDSVLPTKNASPEDRKIIESPLEDQCPQGVGNAPLQGVSQARYYLCKQEVDLQKARSAPQNYELGSRASNIAYYLKDAMLADKNCQHCVMDKEELFGDCPQCEFFRFQCMQTQLQRLNQLQVINLCNSDASANISSSNEISEIKNRAVRILGDVIERGDGTKVSPAELLNLGRQTLCYNPSMRSEDDICKGRTTGEYFIPVGFGGGLNEKNPRGISYRTHYCGFQRLFGSSRADKLGENLIAKYGYPLDMDQLALDVVNKNLDDVGVKKLVELLKKFNLGLGMKFELSVEGYKEMRKYSPVDLQKGRIPQNFNLVVEGHQTKVKFFHSMVRDTNKANHCGNKGWDWDDLAPNWIPGAESRNKQQVCKEVDRFYRWSNPKYLRNFTGLKSDRALGVQAACIRRSEELVKSNYHQLKGIEDNVRAEFFQQFDRNLKTVRIVKDATSFVFLELCQYAGATGGPAVGVAARTACKGLLEGARLLAEKGFDVKGQEDFIANVGTELITGVFHAIIHGNAHAPKGLMDPVKKPSIVSYLKELGNTKSGSLVSLAKETIQHNIAHSIALCASPGTAHPGDHKFQECVVHHLQEKFMSAHGLEGGLEVLMKDMVFKSTGLAH